MFLLAAGMGIGASCSDGDGAAPGSAAAPQDDAASDARARSEIDAPGPGDAGSDVGEDPLSIGSWTPIPGIPSYCGDIARADDPSLWKSKWIPCSSGRTGCRKLDTSWSKTNALPLDFNVVELQRFSLEPARIVNGTGYILWRRFWTAPDRELQSWLDVLEPLDGTPVLVVGQRGRLQPEGWRYFCVAHAMFGDHGVGFMAAPFERTPGSSTPDGGQTYVTGTAPWSAPSPFTMRSLHVVNDFGLGVTSWVSSKTMGANGLWFATRDPDTTMYYDLGTDVAVHAPNGVPTYGPNPIAGGAVVDDVRAPFSIAILSESGTIERLVTPTNPQVVTYWKLDRSTDPPSLVWVESDYGGASYANATLWTAPLVAKEADLARRKVAKLSDALGTGGGWGVANDGMYLSRVGQRTALLTRLSDGMGWLVEAEPNEAFLTPVWVDDESVVITTARYDAQIDAVGHPSGMLRIARSSLGAPTVPSGL